MCQWGLSPLACLVYVSEARVRTAFLWDNVLMIYNAVIVQVYVLFCFDPQEAKYDESSKRDALIDPWQL